MHRTMRKLRPAVVALVAICAAACAATDSDRSSTAAAPTPVEKGPRNQPGTDMGLYSPEQHVLYDGRFVISGSRIFQAGSLSDTSPWDHMDDAAARLREVGGTVQVDVNEIDNSGTFRAELELPEGRYVIQLDQFVEFSPCQDGGIAAFIFEHGDSGCGDSNHPDREVFDHFFAMEVTWK